MAAETLTAELNDHALLERFAHAADAEAFDCGTYPTARSQHSDVPAFDSPVLRYPFQSSSKRGFTNGTSGGGG
jgi:hypothetical protein